MSLQVTTPVPQASRICPKQCNLGLARAIARCKLRHPRYPPFFELVQMTEWWRVFQGNINVRKVRYRVDSNRLRVLHRFLKGVATILNCLVPKCHVRKSNISRHWVEWRYVYRKLHAGLKLKVMAALV